MTPNELAIAKTVAYASLFDFPLTLDELGGSLLESEQTAAELMATFRASARLQTGIEYRDGFFFPRGRHGLVAERYRREARSRVFLDRHQLFLNALCALPFVRMVALSGSIAHLNLDAGGDLDLFIVTRGRHVWSVTVAAVLLAKLLQRRRTVCANFVVSDERPRLDQQDMFAANQIIHLKPLVGAQMYGDLLAANPFVEHYYPNAGSMRPASVPFERSKRLDWTKPILEVLLMLPSRAVETACRASYSWYLRRRARSWQSPEQVCLDADCLKLHTQSHRHSVLERFDAAVSEMSTEQEPQRARAAGMR